MAIDALTGLVRQIHDDLASLADGEVATYIPELAKADPEHFAIAIATVDGEVFSVGDADVAFTIQSMSKPFAYAAALDRLGRAAVLGRVGVEPTGDAFNAIVLDEVNNRPFNPMVNAGAIAVSALFPGDTAGARAEAMLAALSRFAGRPLAVDDAVFASESETGHRNRAIAWLMLNSGMLAAAPDLALDTYFRQCSVLVDTRDLAVMAATLAAGGVNPRTGERAVEAAHLPDVLTVMLTCGMYDYAGQWAWEVGLPAKSGVAGGVVAVVPGQFGIAAYSPRLDRIGNSVRAVAAIRRLSERLSLHGLAARPDAGGALRRVLDGRTLRSKRWRPAADRACLDTAGDRLVVVELAGQVPVGAAERAIRRVGAMVAAGEAVVDLDRVTGVDPGAVVLFDAFGVALAAAGRSAWLVPGRGGRAVADGLGPLARTGWHVAAGLDEAVEAAEDRLLGGGAGDGREAPLPLAAAALLAGLSPEDLDLLAAEVPIGHLAVPKGAAAARVGEPADAVFLVASGRFRVQLPIAGGAPVHLNALGPGDSFGEMALMDDVPLRSADVVAETDATCHVLPIAALRAFGQNHPLVMNRILSRLAADLGVRLRRVNDTIRSLLV
ncbi:glutaminase A [Oharaeibacter diazotrophicus]|uniref:Glutaminase n=1 Tax=Oharaeibacter diazotrophicus TaxID=1920512 RepID=A0A4R6RIC6_9HYPH|nr:glutaminase A [Oharaeibacter diazotrophicus]TDP85617.1 L-glutaminase [Oharaeibacter diazotrophicus]GLS75712.1 glutaminase 2 [Oharaeibacter diazotrophicus]